MKKVKSAWARRNAEWEKHKKLGDKVRTTMKEASRLNDSGDVLGTFNLLQDTFLPLDKEFSDNYQRLRKQDETLLKRYKMKKPQVLESYDGEYYGNAFTLTKSLNASGKVEYSYSDRDVGTRRFDKQHYDNLVKNSEVLYDKKTKKYVKSSLTF